MEPDTQDHQRTVLARLRELLWAFGTANDAQDRGCKDEAEAIRRDSCEAIRVLVEKHAFLTEVFPKLLWQIDSGHVLGVGWWRLSERLDEYVRSLDSRGRER